MLIRSLAVGLGLVAVLGPRGEPVSRLVASRGTAASAHVIPAWYATARTAPATPVQLARVLAMVHAAMHDAVNGAEPRYETYASDLGDVHADPEAAAAGAAHRVLSGLFPALQASWDAALVESLSTIHGGRSKRLGVTLGAAVGQMILNVRANDGWNGVDPFNPEPTPGIWRPTPPAFLPMPEPQFQNVTPFAIENRAQFWLAPPPALTARDYQHVFDEVKSIGRDTSATRTADQTHIAHFWFEPPYDSWSRIAGILQLDNEYDLAPNGAAVRTGEHGCRRRPRFRLVLEKTVRVLATDHGHSGGRSRRQSGYRCGSRVAAAARHTFASGSSVDP